MVSFTLANQVCVVSGLILIFRMFSCCASDEQFVASLNPIGTATRGVAVENTIEKSVILNELTSHHSVDDSYTRTILRRRTNIQPKSFRRRRSIVRNAVDLNKILVFIAESNKLLNSHTKNARLNKLTRTFNNFFKSTGTLSVAVLLNMWSSAWTVIDAVANIIRVNEGRIIDKFEDSTESPAIPMQDVQTSLEETNSNLADVSDLIETLACEFDAGCSRRNGIDPLILQDAQNEESYNGTGNVGKYNTSHKYNLPSSPIYKTLLSTSAGFGSHIYPKQQNNNPIDIRGMKPQPYIETYRNYQYPTATYDRRPVYSSRRNKRRIVSNDYFTGKLIDGMDKANNYLNGKSNHAQLDKFMLEFNNVFNSEGMLAVNYFSTIVASYWTVVDAVANVWRFNEVRIRDAQERQKAASEPDPLDEFQSELQETISNFSNFSNLVNGLPCDFDTNNEDISIGCLDQGSENRRVHTENARALNKGNMFYVPPVKHFRRKLRKNRRKNNRRNSTKTNKQSIQIDQRGNQVKLNYDKRTHNTADVHTFRQILDSANQQTRNFADSTRISETVGKLYSMQQKSSPSHVRRIKPQPYIETNRNFRYPTATYDNREQANDRIQRRTKRGIFSIPSDFYTSRFINWTNNANNYLNSNSNNTKLDTFIRSFNYFSSSSGYYSLNLFYTMIQSAMTVLDAAANIFRMNEARIADGRQRQKDATEPDPLAELQSILNDTNSNLVELVNLANGLPCDVDADIGDIPPHCLNQDNGIQAARALEKGSLQIRPLGFKAKNRLKNRRRNSPERKKQSILVNQRDRVKFSLNNNGHAVNLHTIHQNVPSASQHNRNSIDNQRSSSISQVNIPQPIIQPDRHFYYRYQFNYGKSNLTIQNRKNFSPVNLNPPIASARSKTEQPSNYHPNRHFYYPKSAKKPE